MDERALVIIPAYNEERNISSVVEAVRRAVRNADVCVVDDGSTDGTARVAAACGAVVLRSPMNLGIGGAVQTGYLWARTHGYDVAIQIDGDGQHDPAFLASVIAPIVRDRADVVIGSRFIERRGFQSTATRRIGIRYLSALLKILCGARVTDPTSGFRATGRRAIDLFAQTYPSDYPEPGAIALAIRHGLRVEEVPVQMVERRHGRSTIGIARSLYYGLKVSLELLFQAIPGPRKQAPAGEETS